MMLIKRKAYKEKWQTFSPEVGLILKVLVESVMVNLTVLASFPVSASVAAKVAIVEGYEDPFEHFTSSTVGGLMTGWWWLRNRTSNGDVVTCIHMDKKTRDVLGSTGGPSPTLNLCQMSLCYYRKLIGF